MLHLDAGGNNFMEQCNSKDDQQVAVVQQLIKLKEKKNEKLANTNKPRTIAKNYPANLRCVRFTWILN